jgi:formiminotetrahydrofolate cyclodeaminase
VSAEDVTYYPGVPLRGYMDAAASSAPAPGGGSVSATVGALGAALVSMVCNLTLGKEKFAARENQAKELVEQAEQLRRELILLLQNDTTAYNGVIAAYRLPKETDDEKAARHAAVQKGLIHAADVPLDICRAAVRVCRLARTAAEIGNPAAVTDAGCAALFGEAAAQGAALNVEINLGSIEDEVYKRAAANEAAGILAEAAELRAEVLKTTREKL